MDEDLQFYDSLTAEAIFQVRQRSRCPWLGKCCILNSLNDKECDCNCHENK